MEPVCAAAVPHSAQEDSRVIELVGQYGAKKWSVIAEYLPGRIGKQCRERYDAMVAW